MLMKTFSENVKRYRKIKGFSQEKLAELSGLCRSYIADIETIKRNVSLKNIEKIAIALELEPEKLLKRHDANDA